MHDGSTLTYDLYQPLNQNHDEDVTVAVCPGVGNSSESVYIRTFVHYAQCHGYRTAVLNHIGVIDTIQVTSARIFTYGAFLFYLRLHTLKKLLNLFLICNAMISIKKIVKNSIIIPLQDILMITQHWS